MSHRKFSINEGMKNKMHTIIKQRNVTERLYHVTNVTCNHTLQHCLSDFAIYGKKGSKVKGSQKQI